MIYAISIHRKHIHMILSSNMVKCFKGFAYGLSKKSSRLAP